MSNPSNAAKWTFHDPSSTSSYTVTPSSPNSYTINITSSARTDWWTTAPGSSPESSAHRNSGPVLYQTHLLSPTTTTLNFRLSGRVIQTGNERFQQSTLFIRRATPSVDAHEGQLWLKAGVENEGGKKYVGVVATNPYSDWNVSPLPPSASSSSGVRIEIEKIGPDVHVYYTLEGERLLLREKKGFAMPEGGGGEGVQSH
ncbi:hypothetical protein [Sporisorium scitamineum]|uniref:Uncharacterized protein n=1 Tax=Sporisorium scitamineum TaxID=49012 RepID=A0A0F7S8R0_9BASI|nr:hypothetical protein [Sporisorium scitamineum]